MQYEFKLQGEKKLVKKGNESLKKILKQIDDEIINMRK